MKCRHYYTGFCCRFQQAHSSTNEIVVTLFNQPNHVFTNICLCNGLDFPIKKIQESKHIEEPRRTKTQRTFYCGFVCNLLWGFLFVVSDVLLSLHFFSKQNTFCESKKSSHQEALDPNIQASKSHGKHKNPSIHS